METTRYSIKPRTKKYVKGYGYRYGLILARNFSNKYEKKSLDTATKTTLDAAKIASKKLVHKEE